MSRFYTVLVTIGSKRKLYRICKYCWTYCTPYLMLLSGSITVGALICTVTWHRIRKDIKSLLYGGTL